MLRFFKFNTVLATIACTCLVGNVLASEVNTCSNNLQSNDICPVAVDNKKVTTVKAPLENRSTKLYVEVSQPKQKDETVKLTGASQFCKRIGRSRHYSREFIANNLGLYISTTIRENK